MTPEADNTAHHLVNYGAFKQLSQEARSQHKGEYALYSQGELIAFFFSLRDAISGAYARGLKNNYSVMEVRPHPEDMGFFNSANYPR